MGVDAGVRGGALFQFDNALEPREKGRRRRIMYSAFWFLPSAGVATVSTSPNQNATLCWMLNDWTHHLHSKANEQRASARRFLLGAISQPQNTLNQRKLPPPKHILCFLLPHNKAILCPM